MIRISPEPPAQRSPRREEESAATRATRWAIVLAGGAEARQPPLAPPRAGNGTLPCACSGSDKLLAAIARHTVTLPFPLEQIIRVVTKERENFIAPVSDDRTERNLIVQPQNLGSAPAFLYSLLRLARVATDAPVAFFPSVAPLAEEAFMSRVAAAFRAVRFRPDAVILMGSEPDSLADGDIWIEPESSVLNGCPGAITQVRRLWEKPSGDLQGALRERGCLRLNSVLVGRARVFLELIRRADPALYLSFAQARKAIGTPAERETMCALYAGLFPANFASVLLAAPASVLSVMNAHAARARTWREAQRASIAPVGIGAAAERAA